MVRIKGPLNHVTAHGWLGRYVYKIHGVVPNPYPISFLGKIHIPYPIPAFGLHPYPLFISQYYSITGWNYEMRRTWHGLQPIAKRAAFVANPNSLYQISANITFYDAVKSWQGMETVTKDLYNKTKNPIRMSGYNNFIRLYIREKGNMPINWGREEIVLDIDGGGSVITTGIKADLRIPFPCRIKSWQLFADQVGDIVIDIWKDNYNNFPPTDADSICEGDEPTLSGVIKNKNDTASGFSVDLAEGDILRFNVDSVATVTRVHLSLPIEIL